MPKAGFCKECNKNVWLKEDGSCQFGHPASSISNVYEAQSQKPKIVKVPWYKDLNIVIPGGVLAFIVFLVMLGSFFAALKGSTTVSPEKVTSPSLKTQTEKVMLNIDSPTNGQIVTTPTVEVTGSTEEEATVTINGTRVAVDPNTKTFKLAVNLQEGENTITISANKKGEEAKEIALTVTRELSEAEFKGASKTIPYNQLEKDADKLKGTKVYYRGKIFSIQSSGDQTDIQLDITYKGYDIWDDQVYVIYPGAIDVYKDDVVNVWGAVYGSYSYKSVAGWQMTVPKVDAKYISK